jgi:predicted transcriptional regulator of viral defense system
MIKEILRKKNKQTVFTYKDIASITGKNANSNLISNIAYYVKTGDLIKISKGIYALDKNYSKWEYANKLRRPSYISFYTILQYSGIVFQPYSTIFLACNRSENIERNNQKFKYRKLKDDILLNTKGLKEKANVMIATPERALLDKIYLDGNEHFDNLRNIDWDFAKELNDSIYQSKTIEKFISL